MQYRDKYFNCFKIFAFLENIFYLYNMDINILFIYLKLQVIEQKNGIEICFQTFIQMKPILIVQIF